MKVIIAGTRTFCNYDLLKERCDYFLSNVNVTEIVSGKSSGADKLGENYAREKGYEIKEFPADWGFYGLKAGPVRNNLMAEYADYLLAFWDGKSKGTSDMIKRARQKGLRVRVINYT